MNLIQPARRFEQYPALPWSIFCDQCVKGGERAIPLAKTPLTLSEKRMESHRKMHERNREAVFKQIEKGVKLITELAVSVGLSKTATTEYCDQLTEMKLVVRVKNTRGAWLHSINYPKKFIPL